MPSSSIYQDDLGNTIIHLAAEFNLPSVIQSVLAQGEQEKDFDVEKCINFNIFTMQLTNNTLLSNAFNQITTPLMKAAYSNSVEAANVLLDNNAKIDLVNLYGMSALHIAALAGAKEVWNLIVAKAMAMPELSKITEVEDHLGHTPRSIAARNEWTLTQSSTVTVSCSSNGGLSMVPITAIVSNPIMLEHYTCPPSQVNTIQAPPENTRRLDTLVNATSGILRSTSLAPRPVPAATVTSTSPPIPGLVSSNLEWVNNSHKAALGEQLMQWP